VKLSKKQLKQIIVEEIQNTLEEQEIEEGVRSWISKLFRRGKPKPTPKHPQEMPAIRPGEGEKAWRARAGQAGEGPRPEHYMQMKGVSPRGARKSLVKPDPRKVGPEPIGPLNKLPKNNVWRRWYEQSIRSGHAQHGVMTKEIIRLQQKLKRLKKAPVERSGGFLDIHGRKRTIASVTGRIQKLQDEAAKLQISYQKMWQKYSMGYPHGKKHPWGKMK